MIATLRKPIYGALQPSLGLDHVTAGEPFFPTTIFAERDQLWRSADGVHHTIELLFPVAVSVDEHREVTTSERRLLPRDRIKRDIGIGDDPVAIGTSDRVVFFEPLGCQALRR